MLMLSHTGADDSDKSTHKLHMSFECRPLVAKDTAKLTLGLMQQLSQIADTNAITATLSKCGLNLR